MFGRKTRERLAALEQHLVALSNARDYDAKRITKIEVSFEPTLFPRTCEHCDGSGKIVEKGLPPHTEEIMFLVADKYGKPKK